MCFGASSNFCFVFCLNLEAFDFVWILWPCEDFFGWGEVAGDAWDVWGGLWEYLVWACFFAQVVWGGCIKLFGEGFSGKFGCVLFVWVLLFKHVLKFCLIKAKLLYDQFVLQGTFGEDVSGKLGVSLGCGVAKANM